LLWLFHNAELLKLHGGHVVGAVSRTVQ